MCVAVVVVAVVAVCCCAVAGTVLVIVVGVDNVGVVGVVAIDAGMCADVRVCVLMCVAAYV